MLVNFQEKKKKKMSIMLDHLFKINILLKRKVSSACRSKVYIMGQKNNTLFSIYTKSFIIVTILGLI